MEFASDTPAAGAQAETDHLLKLAAGLGRLGAWSVDLTNNTQTWSNEVCAILELPPGARLSVEEGLQYTAPEHLPALASAFERCAKLGFPYDLQVQVVTARGRRIWVRAIGQPGFNGRGEIVRVHGAFQDITPLVQAHEEKRLLAECLTVTLESMRDGFYVVDHEWRITYANSEAARVMRLRRNDAIGKILWEVFPEALGTIFQREFEKAVRTRESVEFETHYEPLDLWVHVRAFPSSFGLAVAFRDITERHRAKIELQQLNRILEQRVVERTAQLAEAAKELEAFAYAAAHDLRTPMCAGKAFAHALEVTQRGRLDAEGETYLRRLQDALQYMDDMTVSLLGLATLSKAQLRREKVDLSLVAARALEVHKMVEPERHVKIRIQRGLVVHADRVHITQALLNLIGNAWKFTGDTTGAQIAVGARRQRAGERVFYVKDNGPGFDMKAAKRLFEPFARFSAHVDGTGIGLAVVKKIVTLHGGRVWAKAAAGRGACFYFTIPDEA